MHDITAQIPSTVVSRSTRNFNIVDYHYKLNICKDSDLQKFNLL